MARRSSPDATRVTLDLSEPARAALNAWADEHPDLAEFWNGLTDGDRAKAIHAAIDPLFGDRWWAVGFEPAAWGRLTKLSGWTKEQTGQALEWSLAHQNPGAAWTILSDHPVGHPAAAAILRERFASIGAQGDRYNEWKDTLNRVVERTPPVSEMDADTVHQWLRVWSTVALDYRIPTELTMMMPEGLLTANSDTARHAEAAVSGFMFGSDGRPRNLGHPIVAPELVTRILWIEKELPGTVDRLIVREIDRAIRGEVGYIQQYGSGGPMMRQLELWADVLTDHAWAAAWCWRCGGKSISVEDAARPENRHRLWWDGNMPAQALAWHDRQVLGQALGGTPESSELLVRGSAVMSIKKM